MKVKRHVNWRVLLVLALLLGAAFLDSNLRLITTEYALDLDALPAGFDGFRILQLSDLHSAVYGQDNDRLLDAARAARPDLIALTGDLIDKDGELDLGRTAKLLEGLTEIAPVYYVSGNHEWESRRIDALRPVLEQCGVRYLRNESLTLRRGGDELVLLGVEDPCGPADMPKPDAVADAAPEGFRVMLAHRNDVVEKYPDLSVDLLLCGHAHGGVWRIPGVGGVFGHRFKLFPDNVEGVQRSGRTTVVVSRGLGNAGRIPRLMNNPELAVVVLNRTAG